MWCCRTLLYKRRHPLGRTPAACFLKNRFCGPSKPWANITVHAMRFGTSEEWCSSAKALKTFSWPLPKSSVLLMATFFVQRASRHDEPIESLELARQLKHNHVAICQQGHHSVASPCHVGRCFKRKEKCKVSSLGVSISRVAVSGTNGLERWAIGASEMSGRR